MNIRQFDTYLDRIIEISTRADMVIERAINNAKGTKREQLICRYVVGKLDRMACIADELMFWRGACVALDGGARMAIPLPIGNINRKTE